MAKTKKARQSQPVKVEDVRTWWEKRGLRRVRLLRNGRKSVMVWQDKDGNEVA